MSKLVININNNNNKMLILQDESTSIKNNTRVTFSIPGGTNQKRFFLVIDGIPNGPFENNSKVTTPVKNWDIISSKPHETQIAVVNLSKFTVPNIDLHLNDIPVSLPNGTGVLKLSGKIKDISIKCINSNKMIQDYFNNCIDEPESEILFFLKDVASDIVSKTISKLQFNDTYDIISKVNEYQTNIKNTIINLVKSKYPWVSIQLNVALDTVNYNDIETRIKDHIKVTEDIKRDVRLTILDTYKNSGFNQEMANILVSYISNHPEITPEETVRIANQFKDLGNKFDPKDIIRICGQMNLLP